MAVMIEKRPIASGQQEVVGSKPMDSFHPVRVRVSQAIEAVVDSKKYPGEGKHRLNQHMMELVDLIANEPGAVQTIYEYKERTNK